MQFDKYCGALSSPAINKLCRLLPAISVTTCHGPVTAFTARDEAIHWSEIATFAYPTCIPCPR